MESLIDFLINNKLIKRSSYSKFVKKYLFSYLLENKVDKHLESDLNRVKAQLKQLNESELFSKEDQKLVKSLFNINKNKISGTPVRRPD